MGKTAAKGGGKKGTLERGGRLVTDLGCAGERVIEVCGTRGNRAFLKLEKP